MKKDTELEEYKNLMNLKEEDFSIAREDAMLLAMSEKYGKNPNDRDSVITSLKERIEKLYEEDKIKEALISIEKIKNNEMKVYPIDTLWEQI